ncbi:MAG: hypothetical protein ACREU5_07245 [Burkholderiales bacterium]
MPVNQAKRKPAGGPGQWIALGLALIAAAGGMAWFFSQQDELRREDQAHAAAEADLARARAKASAKPAPMPSSPPAALTTPAPAGRAR